MPSLYCAGAQEASIRIAVVNRSNRLAGGIEVYLETVLTALRAAGHDIALFHETDAPAVRAALTLPEDSARWCVAARGAGQALAELQTWRPDLLFVNTIDDTDLEARLLDIAPAVFFAHQYHGTCISGGKSYKQIVQRPCHRVFGPGCYAHYYPHRCGGLNPVVMVQEYGRQSRRLRLLGRYRSVVTHSDHMRNEYLRHGLEARRVCKVPFPAAPEGASASLLPPPDSGEPWRLLFAARMEVLKGAHLLLEAVSAAQRGLDHPLVVTLAGDGQDRPKLQERAERIVSRQSGLELLFPGWLSPGAMKATLAGSHLLVVPSFWPEPFGMVGPEAGAAGVPAVAFAVGGIPEWLSDGVNGFLAPADPPKAAGLAAAICRALSDRATYARLRAGAVREADRFTMSRHLPALMDAFQGAVRA